ncbi:hypothetical protein CC1G_02165 [Coprinopsis cinerea okayama7|uniref:Helicase ATP-binding domain-containing protein n=1 Tax=Coprinopsis cinerea (strain Okayama-7 / 130 / ATCC MYA-4618 / FGSC 9003) TaxID=240176 RepID=A8NKE9_COPC7|nr:hypothetical protein CC1G_02165 [Coprinopsis cinerea okayama7\|eukprot:XP_001834429.2 hypothetical protein CC1G_02165 [Coprinopsis cinerea okayama7\
MLDTTTRHYESVQTPPPRRPDDFQHRCVNLKLLEELVQKALKAAQGSSRTLRKRGRSPEDVQNASKRVKTDSGAVATSSSATGYQYLPQNQRSFTLEPGGRDEESVSILRHVFVIEYSELNPTGSDDERTFARLVTQVNEQKSLDIGAVRFFEEGDHVVAGTDEGRWLLFMPSLSQDADDYDYSTTPAVSDLLAACVVLRDAQKVELEGNVTVVMDPSEPSSFQLKVELVVSLVLPNIFLSLHRKATKKNILFVENAQRRMLSYVYGDRDSTVNNDINISHFYSILHAAKNLSSKLADDAMQPDLLNPTLLPFQRRSVGWLLGREGRDVLPDGSIVPCASLERLMYSFWDTITEGNHTWYFNRLSAQLTTEPPESPPPAFGGILAEEPGLGKTLETISLILLNPAPDSRNPSVTRWDPEARLDVKAVRTSLIVTPVSLASQWIDEIRAHAPSLKVLVYDGWSSVKVPITRTKLEEERAKGPKVKEKAPAITTTNAKKKTRTKTRPPTHEEVLAEELARDKDGHLLEWCDYVQQFDVVITTYQVLKTDFNVARAAPLRPRREDVVYLNIERPRSPLVMVEWNRVIMDEVQMVGGGKVEDMVSLIPRLSSFAVSGTPAKAQISDMIHVLRFLRVDDVIGSSKLWHRLLKPGFASEFAAFFQTYAIRTTKASVKQELTIPQQTRYLVPIELGKVERHVYDQTLEAILLDLGLDARGVAATEGWEVDPTLLRSSIRRLRGICTHPQVGQLQRRGDMYKKGALKTMDAVLESMRDQSWKHVMEHWKAKIHAMTRYAQLIQRDEFRPNRHQLAREALEAAEQEANKHIEEINNALAEHKAKGEVLKKEAAARRRELAQSESSETDKGKGKAVAEETSDEDDHDDDDSDEEHAEDKGLPKTPAGKEHRSKTQALKSRLREGKLLLHQVKFLQGDVFHVLGEVHAADEDAAYEAAEKIRRDLLQATEDEATRAMTVLQEGPASVQRPSQADLKLPVPFFGQGGIRSSELMEEVNTIIEDVLNPQTKLLFKWRARIMELLTKKLNPGEEADGREYERNLDDQGEVEVLLQAYAALLADRREALVNERTLLAAHDARDKRLRQTKAASKAALALDFLKENQYNTALQLPKDFEVNAEFQVQYKEMTDARKKLVAALGGRAIKSVLIDLNGVSARITNKKDPERLIVNEAVASIRRLMQTQATLHDKLDADLALMRKAFNERILYFRQLQEISDSVAEVEWEEPTLEMAIEVCAQMREDHDARINTGRARLRYVTNLVDSKEGNAGEDDEENRSRVAVNPDTVQRFTVSTDPTDEAPKQPINGETVPMSRRKIAYNTIDREVYDQIQNMESYGDYGSKIQTLIRHLLYVQTTDPGSKSIVFSAWADSLHSIRCLRIDQNSRGESAAKKFRTDEEILVLLLHGERENAGLNVTFYCYYAEDTVERNILDLAARKGLSLYTKENSAGTLDVSSFSQEADKAVVDSPAKKRQKGDFIFRVDDMLAVLFPHMYEDIEFLLPPSEGGTPSEDIEMGDVARHEDNPFISRGGRVNAVAGPSRLR